MVETGVAPPGIDESYAEQFEAVTWTDQIDERLAQARYPENVDLAPGQLQAAASTFLLTEGAVQRTVMFSGVALVFSPIGPIPKPRRRPQFDAIQEWEGVVLEKLDDHFIARLIDVTAGIAVTAGTYEEADFPYSAVLESDLQRLLVGSIFRWVIGYETDAGGTKKRVSRVVLRNLPVITAHDVARGEEWARDILQRIRD